MTRFQNNTNKSEYFMALGNSVRALFDQQFSSIKSQSYFRGRVSLPLFLHPVKDLSGDLSNREINSAFK